MPVQPTNNGMAAEVRRLCLRLIDTHFSLGIVGRAFRDIWLPEITAAIEQPSSYPDVNLQDYRGFNHTAQEFLAIGQATWPLFNLLDEDTEAVRNLVLNTEGMNPVEVHIDLIKLSIAWVDKAPVRVLNPLNARVNQVISQIVDNANDCRRMQLLYRATTQSLVEGLAEDQEQYEGVTKAQWMATIDSIASYANYCFGYSAALGETDTTTKGYGHGDTLAAF